MLLKQIADHLSLQLLIRSRVQKTFNHNFQIGSPFTWLVAKEVLSSTVQCQTLPKQKRRHYHTHVLQILFISFADAEMGAKCREEFAISNLLLRRRGGGHCENKLQASANIKCHDFQIEWIAKYILYTGFKELACCLNYRMLIALEASTFQTAMPHAVTAKLN